MYNITIGTLNATEHPKKNVEDVFNGHVFLYIIVNYCSPGTGE
jgi:hypothetical protein